MTLRSFSALALIGLLSGVSAFAAAGTDQSSLAQRDDPLFVLVREWTEKSRAADYHPTTPLEQLYADYSAELQKALVAVTSRSGLTNPKEIVAAAEARVAPRRAVLRIALVERGFSESAIDEVFGAMRAASERTAEFGVKKLAELMEKKAREKKPEPAAP